MTSENIALKDQLTSIKSKDLKTIESDHSKNIQSIEEVIEARTNRMMRKTLVFKNIPESANENWAETEKQLATAIHDIADIPLKEAASYLERAHRAAPIEGMDGPRPIFCAFYDWKMSEMVKERLKTITLTIVDKFTRSRNTVR